MSASSWFDHAIDKHVAKIGYSNISVALLIAIPKPTNVAGAAKANEISWCWISIRFKISSLSALYSATINEMVSGFNGGSVVEVIVLLPAFNCLSYNFLYYNSITCSECRIQQY